MCTSIFCYASVCHVTSSSIVIFSDITFMSYCVQPVSLCFLVFCRISSHYCVYYVNIFLMSWYGIHMYSIIYNTKCFFIFSTDSHLWDTCSSKGDFYKHSVPESSQWTLALLHNKLLSRARVHQFYIHTDRERCPHHHTGNAYISSKHAQTYDINISNVFVPVVRKRQTNWRWPQQSCQCGAFKMKKNTPASWKTKKKVTRLTSLSVKFNRHPALSNFKC